MKWFVTDPLRSIFRGWGRKKQDEAPAPPRRGRRTPRRPIATSVQRLERALSLKFQDPLLLELALTHPSYCHENPGMASNERLEFLGDAVLGLVVGEALYRRDAGLSEGQMTELRARLVSGEALAEQAAALGLGKYLLLGKGEEVSGGRERPSNMARGLEALIGAVYLDQGLGAAQAFLEKAFGRKWPRALRGAGPDYKSRLQAAVQARGGTPPVYRTVEVSGPGHARRFTVEVTAGDLQAQGTGSSKKRAEQAAARTALKKLGE